MNIVKVFFASLVVLVSICVPAWAEGARVDVQVQARDYRDTQMTGSGSNLRLVTKRIDFDEAALRSRIRSSVAATGMVVVDGGPADYLLRVDYRGNDSKIRGTFTLLDASGRVIAEETRAIGMPLFADDNMTGAAMKRAGEIADKIVPGLLRALSALRPLAQPN